PPASGPRAPVPPPPLSCLPLGPPAGGAPPGAATATAIAAMPIAPTVENRTCRRLILPSLQCLGLSRPLLSNDIPDCISLRSPGVAERPEGADYQWRKIPLGELSIDPVADERLVRATARAGASRQRLPLAAERYGGP